jgi:hypothetical protein
VRVIQPNPVGGSREIIAAPGQAAKVVPLVRGESLRVSQSAAALFDVE